jgi:hypothetical protein
VLAQFGAGKRRQPARGVAVARRARSGGGVRRGPPAGNYAPCGSGTDPRPRATIRLSGGAGQILALVPIASAGRSDLLLFPAPLAGSVLGGPISPPRRSSQPIPAHPLPIRCPGSARIPLIERALLLALPELATLAQTRRHVLHRRAVTLAIALRISGLLARDFSPDPRDRGREQGAAAIRGPAAIQAR